MTFLWSVCSWHIKRKRSGWGIVLFYAVWLHRRVLQSYRAGSASIPTLAPLAHNFERPKFCLSLVQFLQVNIYLSDPELFCVRDTQALICVCACVLFVYGPRIMSTGTNVSRDSISGLEKRSDWLTPWWVTMFIPSRGTNYNVDNK